MPVRHPALNGSSRMMKRAFKNIFLGFIFSFLLVGCKLITPTTQSGSNPTQTNDQNIAVTPTSTPVPTVTSAPTPSPSPTAEPFLVWLPPYLPEKLRSAISLPAGYSLAQSSQPADFSLQVGDENTEPASQWTYALVAPFPTVTDGVSSEELASTWGGKPATAFKHPLLLDESTYEVLSIVWGPADSAAVQVMPATELVDYAWANQPAWAIIPFEMLEPRWKVLSIDGQSPLSKDFDPSAYALNISFSLSGDGSLKPVALNIPPANHDASRLTTVAMTGVTALVRATAYTMELQGINYPAEDVGQLLSSADITHISNEIPFSPDCPYPAPKSDNLVFCSNPKYIDLLKDVGTDVIELTGDHFMDYGADATIYTLQMYKDLGWPYFGGGANAEDARKPALFENNGNKIAFMGCNVGCDVKTAIPCTAIATADHPGASQCDFDWIASEISRLKQDGYQVIFTFQHIEYYKYTIEPILQTDFEKVADAGASIVSGSQAHQPHGFEFKNGAFLHYGLGNLFFDQYHFCGDYACDNAFIDRHVFYDGRYVSTELIPIHFVDWARPRLMTPEERANFLQIMFDASGW